MNTYSVQALRQEWVSARGIASEDFLLLALFVTSKEKADFFRESDILLTHQQHEHLVALLERRVQHEPIAYLVGKKEFFGRDFAVNADTLIPRPDSECLIEDIVQEYGTAEVKPAYIFDIGTGSGALAITLQQELSFGSHQVFASDISLGALTVAKSNAHQHRATVTFLHGSFLEPYREILTSAPEVFIVANLPYVSEKLLAETEPDVQEYEPVTALLSEEEGLAHYRLLLKELLPFSEHLSFTCWLEISPEQTDTLTKDILILFPDANLYVGKDLAKRDRFIRFQI